MSIDLNLRHCQSEGKDPMDWRKAINDAVADCDPDTWDYLRDQSDSWVTCAVGNMCNIIPREENTSAPLDNELRELGLLFHGAISNWEADRALTILNAIEKRSAKLIDEIITARLITAITNILNDKSHGTRHVSEQKDLCSAVGPSESRG